MRDLDKALADILAIRGHIAAGTAFRGYGPTALAATGGLALLTALGQSWWIGPSGVPVKIVLLWMGTAVLSAAIIGVEMVARSRRHHSGLADAMIHQAVEQFLPAAAGCVFLALVLGRFVPEAMWMLPGLWQLLVSLGVFASVRSLPRSVALVGAWYFVAGLCVLVVGSEMRIISPWMMGVPFTVGQFLMAAILHLAGAPNAEDQA